MKSLRLFLFIVLAGGAVCLARTENAHAQAKKSVTLAGQVSSTEEGPMEGVVVTAKKDGSTIAISVSTDAQGRYSFPSAKLEPGHYSIQARAAGYDLDGPPAVDIPAGKTAMADIKLHKTANLAAQLTNAEWLNSMPGTWTKRHFCEIARLATH
jgi:virginiamycin B lyase